VTKAVFSMHRSARFVLLLALLSFAVTGCARPTTLYVPMEHKPTLHVNPAKVAGAVPASVKLFIPPVQDVRNDLKTLGENREKPKKPVPIIASTPPAEYVHRALITELLLLDVSVLGSKTSSTHTLTLTLRDFSANESPDYHAVIAVRGKLTDALGHVRWEGSVTGQSKRDESDSLDEKHYQTVIGDSMIKLIERLLTDPAFQAALRVTVDPLPPRTEAP